MIRRKLEGIIRERVGTGKAIILLGPRQVGKTTLVKRLFSNDPSMMWLNADELDVQKLFEDISATRIKAILGDKKILIIDEAQRIKDVGLRLKLITDQLQEVQLVVTGSSSFEIANHTNEPLTGRKWEYKMFPLSFGEMVDHHGLLEEKRLIPQRLVYGYYPDVVNHVGMEKEILKQLSDSFLYKDLLSIDQIKKSDGIIKLLQALAFQVGSQVSYNELAQIVGLNIKTVEKYITVLEQAFIIFKLTSFSRNLRNELKQSRKIYFYDNGIRNALIANFNQVENRVDIGALWENFLISERMKFIHYGKHWINSWYWRTKEQREIDYVEEAEGILTAYEFKWNPVQKPKLPLAFKNAYPEATFKCIHRDNFDEFLL